MKVGRITGRRKQRKMNTAIKVIAQSPPAILLALGGVGLLLQKDGAGTLLTLGFILQVLWLLIGR